MKPAPHGMHGTVCGMAWTQAASQGLEVALSEACRVAVEASRAQPVAPVEAGKEGEEAAAAAAAAAASRVVREYMKLRQAVHALYGDNKVTVSFKVGGWVGRTTRHAACAREQAGALPCPALHHRGSCAQGAELAHPCEHAGKPA